MNIPELIRRVKVKIRITDVNRKLDLSEISIISMN